MTDISRYAPLAAAIPEADDVRLYEGTPHNGWERDLLRRELATDPHIELHGYSFYKEPLRLKAGDGERLTRLFTDKGSFMPYGGPKTCGGYHPDYGIE